MPNPVSVNFSIYLLPWPPDQTFWDCKISHELPLPLEELYMGKEQKSGAAGRNLVLALASNRNITQGWKVAHTDTVSPFLLEDAASRSIGTLTPPGHVSHGVSQPNMCQQLYEAKACSHSLQHRPNARGDFLGFILHLSGYLEKKKKAHGGGNCVL